MCFHREAKAHEKKIPLVWPVSNKFKHSLAVDWPRGTIIKIVTTKMYFISLMYAVIFLSYKQMHSGLTTNQNMFIKIVTNTCKSGILFYITQ